MASVFGKLFQITTFGESHGKAVGVVIDGCPAGCEISLAQIQGWLGRRRPGQSHLTTPRDEKDQVHCYSGIEDGKTLGSPITLLVYNEDQRPKDYDKMQDIYRPSHSDFTTATKYGLKAKSGGGRSSARETIGRVAAAALAEQVLATMQPSIKVTAWVSSVKDISYITSTPEKVTKNLVDQSLVRCPDENISRQMIQLIEQAKAEGDSVGGMITCCIQGCPVGLGEPIFDKLEADLAKAMLSLPATKSFEIGSGIEGTKLFGSQHNDEFIKADSQIRTKTNNSGGIQGGISNGENIIIRVGFKPTSTIMKTQKSVDSSGKEVEFAAKGRHDPCVLPRAVPMVEAMATLVIIDHYLRNKTIKLT